MKKNILLFIFCILLNQFSHSQGFTVSGSNLLDANGNNFIMKGINVPLAWFVNDVNSNIANIKNVTKANCLRIVVTTSTTDNAWQTCVQQTIDNNMIPMVELHDVTGSNTPADLQNMANWWASKASYLTQPNIAKYILINIANEWGDWFMSSPTNNPSQTVWRDAYINAVQTLRNAGINTTIVVDAPGYGQDNQGSTLLNYADAVQLADPLHNVLFSLHMYCEWMIGGNSSVSTHLPAIKNAGIPIMIGEFGYQHASDGSCDIDEQLIMNTAQANGIGWLAWSWKGNGGGVEYLDLSVNWSGSNLSAWGNTVVNGTNGTKTSVEASVFAPQAAIVGTPPSCVITAPHCNAYFQSNSTIVLNVQARDIGGTFANGTVTKVEFFNGATKLGEDLTAPYSYNWTSVPAGTYTITAKATDNDANVSTSAGVIINVGAGAVSSRGMSACKGKYLGNIIPGSVRSDYNTLWNAVTAENSCKWGSVESTRDVFNWSGADLAYNHALSNNMPFRYHALAWGSQYPSWITSLSPADFKAEMEEYMAAVAARYPRIDQIDVLNEALRTHAPGTPYFRDGLGGVNGGVAPDNNTGYDWAVWLFRKARQYFPNSKLVLNDYGLENDATAINEMLQMVKVLRDRNLIDGFGTQAHTFNVDGLTSTTLQTRLDLMATGGVPVYVTELDLTGSPSSNSGTDATQLTSYQNLFPVYWNHQYVAGVTLWGYVEGQTWRAGTGLLNSNGTEKPAMTWLKQYMAGRTDIGYPFCGSGPVEPPPAGSNLLNNGEFNDGTISWEIQNNSGANGTMTVVNPGNMSGPNALRICPTTPGTADWHVQVRQNAPFEAGKEYIISFVAKADANRTMNVGIQMEGDPWTSYFGGSTSLTTVSQSFSFNFNPLVSDATAKLKFYVGNNTTCVTIDNVVFQEATANQPPTVNITAPANNSSVCQGTAITLTATAADTDGTISKVEFFDGATLLSTVTTAPYTYSWTNAGTGAHSITARATDNGTAVTTSTAINITVNATPVAPTVTTPVTYCQNAIVTALTATGTGLKWYTAPSGGAGSATAPTPSTASVGTTNHYVSQTINGCEGPRALIAVTVNATPAAPSVTTPVTYCQNATATALTATGTALKWYTAPSGGAGSATAPTPSTASAGTTNHYVSQTINGCEGPRALIAVTVNATPAAPTITTPVTYCQNATATALTATGTGLKWYTAPSGGTGSATAPTPSTTSLGTTNHYVSQTISGCEGPRALIEVTVNATPAAPSVTTPVTYCQNATATALTATGTALKWYTAPSGGAGSATAPTPSTASAGTTNHYVSQTVSGCEGTRALIKVTVNAAPSPSNAGSDQYIAVTSTSLSANVPASGTGAWIVVGGSGNIADASAFNTSVVGLSTGANTFEWRITSGSCAPESDEVVIYVGSAPGSESISGPVSVTAGTSSVTYSIPADPASSFEWTVTGGAMIVDGQGTNSILVDFGSTPGSVTISVKETNEFGETTSSVNVSTGNAPAVSSISGPSIVETGQTYTFTVPIDPDPNTTYNWSVPNGAVIENGIGTNSIEVSFPAGTTSGNVSVTAENSFGTNTGSLPVTVSTATFIHSARGGMSSTLYPNPFTDKLSITINSPVTEKMSVRIIDMKGKVVFEADGYYTNETIFLGEMLPHGMYVLQAVSNGKLLSEKIEKMK